MVTYSEKGQIPVTDTLFGCNMLTNSVVEYKKKEELGKPAKDYGTLLCVWRSSFIIRVVYYIEDSRLSIFAAATAT